MPKTRQYIWIVPVVICFLVVYLFSLTFVYIEGDDAASIAYHAAGHNPKLIEPFVPYHSMMDAIISVFPSHEALLRPLSMFITSIAAIIMAILMFELAFELVGVQDARRKTLIAVVILPAVPELFYLGLVYLPSVIAMCFVLGAHLLIRNTLRHSAEDYELAYWKRPRFLIAAILFGIGSACRWDVLVYGIVITADLFFVVLRDQDVVPQAIQRFTTTFIWGTAALVSTFTALTVSGYPPAQVLIATTGIFASEHQALAAWGDTEIWKVIGGLSNSLFTPPYLLLAFVGFLSLLFRRLALALSLVVGIATVLTIVPWLVEGGQPKQIITALPSLITFAVAGFVPIWYEPINLVFKLGSRFVLVAALAAIWLVGIHVDNSTAWGPGFELRPFDRPQYRGNLNFSIAFGAGMALSLPEGPRPLFGHAQVLLGGLWRTMANEVDAEQRNAVETAISLDIPELRIERQIPGVAVFLKLDYSVEAVQDYGSLLRKWNFVGKNNKYGTMLALYDWNAMNTSGGINQIRRIANHDTVVIYGYPAEMRKLYLLSPDAFEKLGPTSAILDLGHLYNTVSNQSVF